MNTRKYRHRSFVVYAIGIVMSFATALVVANFWQADAAPGDTDSTFVPITPCRLFDTRLPGEVPFGPGATRSFAAHGTNGACTIPTTAVGLSLNVTAVGATADTYLTIWPDDEPMPLASSLNPWPGEPPTPNAVATELSPVGRFKVYNHNGVVDVLADINGYYIKSSLQEINQRLLALEAANPGPRIAALEAAQPPVVVAHAESGNVDEAVFGGGQNANILTVNLNAPASGTLVINGSVDLFAGASANRIRCQIDIDGTFIGGSAMYSLVDPPTNSEENCATTLAWPVAAGNHTVTFEVRDRVTANLDDASLWAIWIRNS